ncbi:MAG: MFS transporter [Paracoccaceae bacterium]
MLLLRNRNYRLLFSANAVSNLGDGVSAVAFPWLASLFTRDALLISLVAMAGRLPWFLFALPVGVWTDRTDRQRLVVRSGLMRCLLTLGVVWMILALPPLPLTAGAASLAVAGLAVISFLLGTAEVFGDNAAQTLLPSVVAQDDLEHANGQMWSAEQVMGQFVGPPLAGVLIGLGLTMPFGFDAMTFALAAVLVWLIAAPPRAVQAVPSFRAAFMEGVRWMRGHPVILRLAVMLGILNALHMAALAVMVLFAQDILGLDAVGYGLLLSFGAFGGVAGGLIAPRLVRQLGMRRSLILSLAIFASTFLVWATTSHAEVAAAALAAEAFGSMIWNVATVSYRQRVIPDAILGRVNAIYRFFGWGAMPLGALLGGVMVTLATGIVAPDMALRFPFAVAATGCLALLAYAAAAVRED